MKIETVSVPTDHYINAKRVSGSAGFEVRTPIDNSILGACAAGDGDLVDRAVGAARAAFRAWAEAGAVARGVVLRRFAQRIRENNAALSIVESVDNGGLRHAIAAHIIERSAQNIEFFAGRAEHIGGEMVPGSTNTDIVAYEPAGVAALITPWNGPLMLSTWKLGPALAAGNTVVLKPPELAPLSCSLLANLAEEAGVPPGVFNVVHGDGSVTGQALADHPGISRISFTGSPQTGRKVATAAATNLVPVSLELGGKSPFVVFASADLDAAATTAARQYFNAGQVCVAGTRVLAERSIAESLLEKIREKVGAMRVGDPRDERTSVGPLISARQFERVKGFVDRARAQGAEVLFGGRQHSAGELYFEPTLLAPVSQKSEIVQNEVFGPVLTWQIFDDEAEAVTLANDTVYGLAAVIFTGDAAQGERVGKAIVAGTVWVNSFFVRNLAAPFGGFRMSGVGVEGGDHSFDFFCNIKNLSINSASFLQGTSSVWRGPH
ncbi:aldehyde dehydrogenase family protein [Bradyrhizobium neotropicale]|uniref:Betaine-aldehyde dehydrogenase n=1 Tax=Bradyrhizobium neotropicale TaxID=1497615 RepID=A0A176ZDZ9_9BRAD|nr:aldehyde dehydrogenase family protein [Bradyrhizobium neotropicale]OAF18809.1 betaine-aldehyde dehydrogenase [Bradyrhizobium neotropicale]